MRVFANLTFLAIILTLALPPAAAPGAEPPKTAAADPDPAPPSAEQLFADGSDALFQGEYKKAVELLAKAVAADDSKTSYKLHLARAHRYAGDDKKAETILEKVLDAAPDHVEAG